MLAQQVAKPATKMETGNQRLAKLIPNEFSWVSRFPNRGLITISVI
jgi:hypothetical protein